MQQSQFEFPAVPDIANPELDAHVQSHLDDLTKPKGSLGRLEWCAARYLRCRGSATAELKRMQLYTFAADHGIAAQGITPYPQEVTAQMVLNMLGGGAAVSVMTKNAGIESYVVDMGVASELPDHPRLIQQNVAAGTADFSSGYAMTPEQCAAAIQAGEAVAQRADADLLGVGEMGIANTASASALYALLLGLDGAVTTGAGTGARGQLLEKKRYCIHTAVVFHQREWDGTVFDALCRCGGFEIAALTGFMLGAAARRIPVVVDGFICGAAALAALFIERNISEFLFFSHVSAEEFHREFLRQENIRPLLDLEMRLGEGTGAVLAMQIIQQAVSCYHRMATFSSAAVTKEHASDV